MCPAAVAPDVAEYVEVQEGRARLRVPAAQRAERGPASKEAGPVFFNPAMATNRDLSCLLMAVKAQPGWQVLDGLAASGLRGLRYALECDVPLDVEWNDWNPVAVKLLEENAALNGLPPKVTRRNLSSLLHEKVWHAVDLDPFGSPAPFLDGATRAVRDGGLLGITATDTTGLAGVYPNVCRRRYMAEPLHGELGHEVALRILAGIAARQGARHDVAFRPVLAHATDHYYRVSVQCRRGAARADEALKHVGMLAFCPACGHRSFTESKTCPDCGGKTRLAGPLWTGPMHDVETLDAMHARAGQGATLHRARESRHLLAVLVGEARAPPLFYDVHKVGERLKIGSPPMARIVQGLEEAGHPAWPVHFNRLALRTSASAAEMARIVRDAGEGR
jgi:tRNA (guanine26-N2/guanine27-N2)-dimethyltransferase